MFELNKAVPKVKIINLTGMTIRDIVITYEGYHNPIEILKIKNEYDKTIILNPRNKNKLVDLKLIYKDKEYTIYKQFNTARENFELEVEIYLNKDNNLIIKNLIIED